MKIALLIFAYILYMLSAPFICKLAIMLQYRPYREDLALLILLWNSIVVKWRYEITFPLGCKKNLLHRRLKPIFRPPGYPPDIDHRKCSPTTTRGKTNAPSTRIKQAGRHIGFPPALRFYEAVGQTLNPFRPAHNTKTCPIKNLSVAENKDQKTQLRLWHVNFV